MVRFLGYFNACLVVILSMRAPYMVWFRRTEKTEWKKILTKSIRRLHPIFGGVLAVTGITHGYMAWGWNFRHTGYLLYVFVLIQAILGIGLLRKKRSLKNMHRLVSVGTLFLLGLHIFYRTALG